jgi:ABC-type transport system involved in cytochrome c biogenesis permease subunit
VPESEIVCGLPPASSVIVNVPALAPLVVRVKVTLIAHWTAAATEAPHVSVSEKSLLTAMPVIFKMSLPVFFSVSVWAALLVPTIWLPNARLVEERLTPGPVPVPVKENYII